MNVGHNSWQVSRSCTERLLLALAASKQQLLAVSSHMWLQNCTKVTFWDKFKKKLNLKRTYYAYCRFHSLSLSRYIYIYIYNFVKIIIIGIDLSSFARFTVQNNYLGLYTGPKCSPLKSSSGKQSVWTAGGWKLSSLKPELWAHRDYFYMHWPRYVKTLAMFNMSIQHCNSFHVHLHMKRKYQKA